MASKKRGTRGGRKRNAGKMFIRVRPPEDGFPSMVMFEGDAAAFALMAEWFAQAGSDPDVCGSQRFPGGPGGACFDPECEVGLYLHRLPCTSDPPMSAKD